MHVADMRRDAGIEVERRFRDRKRVAGVDADSNATRLLAEADKFVAAEILMILDRQHAPVISDDRPVLLQRGAHAFDQLRPLCSLRRTVTAQHGSEPATDRRRAERARGAQRALERPHHQPPADDWRHSEFAEPVFQR